MSGFRTSGISNPLNNFHDFLIKLLSSNGTILNDVKLEKNKAVLLKTGSEIVLVQENRAKGIGNFFFIDFP